MKKATLIICLTLATMFVKAQSSVPDTSITIKTTNNQLYQLNALLNAASQNLLKSEMPVAQYVEFQKQYQALLQIWFKQKEDQIKAKK